MLASMHQNVVPWLVLLWLTPVGKVPVIVRLTGQVECHHNTTVFIPPVPHELTWFEQGFGLDGPH